MPHWENLRRALKENGTTVDHESDEALAGHQAVTALLQMRIDAALKDVSSPEQVKKFLVLPHPFTVAADELTVSLKLRRNVVLTKYAAQLEALYKDNRDD